MQFARADGRKYKWIMGIAEGITATKAALDVTRIILDGLNRPQIDASDVRMKVQEMLIHVVNAQIALSEAQSALHDSAEKNRQLQAQITDLETTGAIQDSLVFGDEVYLRRKLDGSFEGPFCPACWDVDGKLVRLKLDYVGNHAGADQGGLCRKYDCIVHNISYFMSAAKFNTVNVC